MSNNRKLTSLETKLKIINKVESDEKEKVFGEMQLPFLTIVSNVNQLKIDKNFKN